MANPDRSVYDPPFDDDLIFDTVDENDTSRGRPLMILLGIVVLLAFAAVVWVAYRQGVEHAGRSEPPLLAQDPGPVRVAAPSNQGPAVPDNPIYDEIGSAPAAAPTPEALGPAPEVPVDLPPAASSTEAPPAPSPVEPSPDMTVGEIPSAVPTRTAAVQPSIPAEITGEPPVPNASVDPLSPGASLPPVPDVAPPAAEIAPPAVMRPSPAELAAAKAEKDRLAKEAAAKKAEAARLAEERRKRELAAATPAPTVAAVSPPPPAVGDNTIAPSETAAPPSAGPSTTARPDASGRPVSLTPQTIDLSPPAQSAATPPAAPTPAQPSASTAAPVRSAVVTDETPDAAPAAPSGGASQYVVQIGAFNSAEDAAASWKRMEGSFSSALGGAAPEIRQTEVNGKTKYRLRATGYADRNAANGACNRLKAAGQSCFVASR